MFRKFWMLQLLAVSFWAHAEENCGTMVVTAIRVDGSIERIEPIGTLASSIDVGEADPRFVVRLRPIQNAGKVLTPEPLRAPRLDVAVHSQTRANLKLGPGRFQFLSMSYNGAFRKLIGFGHVPIVPTEFTGHLEAGGLYRAEAFFDGEFLQTVEAPIPPRHHLAGLSWSNLDEFPQLRQGKRTRIVFHVERRETEQRGEREWWTSWDSRILRADSAASTD